MSGTARLAVIVLAAGHSRRFGAADKLLTHYQGKPLAAHIAASLIGIPRAFLVVVARNRNVAGLFHALNCRTVFLKQAATQSQSLKAGLHYAESHGASHVLLLLADMPAVTNHHLKTMIRHIGIYPVMSQSDQMTLPPALIPRVLFKRLMQMQGDKGAGAYLRHCPNLIRCSMRVEEAIDIDVPLKKQSGHVAPSRSLS